MPNDKASGPIAVSTVAKSASGFPCVRLTLDGNELVHRHGPCVVAAIEDGQVYVSAVTENLDQLREMKDHLDRYFARKLMLAAHVSTGVH